MCACVLCAVHTTHTPLCDMLPHHQVKYKLPDDGRRPKHVGTIFVLILILILNFSNFNK